MRPRLPLLVTGPWDARDGDPGSPEEVFGLPVVRLLCTRGDAPGALVELADRRYALTGPTVAVGPASRLRRYLRRRAPDCPAYGLWLAELARTLDAETGRNPR